MKRKLKYIVVYLVIFLSTNNSILGQAMSQDKIKAIYILNFARFVEWPNPENLKEISIGVVGNENIFNELIETAKYCSIGQITSALYLVGGQYRRNM